MGRGAGGSGFLILLLLGAFLLLTQPGRVAVQTGLLLPNLFPDAPVKPLAVLGESPTRTVIRYPYAGGAKQAEADLYRPSGPGQFPGVVFSLGVNPVGRREARVLSVVEGLSKSGLVVLVHESPDLTAGRVAREDVDGLVAAFQQLRSQNFVGPRQVGFIGFSVGGGLCLVAAADERIRGQVAFVHAFGSYYDAPQLFAEIAGQSYQVGRERADWGPDPLTVQVFRRHLLEGLSPAEQERVEQLLQRPDRLELGRLGGQGAVVYDLIQGVPLERATELVGQLPARTRETLRLLSPSAIAELLQTRVFLMHDRADKLIPFVHSRQLAQALPPGLHQQYNEFELFQHVTPTTPGDPLVLLREVGRFYGHVYGFMATLGELAQPPGGQ